MCAIVFAAVSRAQETKVFSVPSGALAKAKVNANPLEPALKRLIKDADTALEKKPLSVMDKPKTWPGVDKHDYFSTAPYFWPNPDTTNGLPYIRKDGQRNPDSHNAQSDSSRMGKIMNAAQTLAVAYYFTGKEAYAAHAAKLVRVWFLDPATRMNPNLDHAQ